MSRMNMPLLNIPPRIRGYTSDSPRTPTPQAMQKNALFCIDAGKGLELPPLPTYGADDDTPRDRSPGQRTGIQQLHDILAKVDHDDLDSLSKIRDAVVARCNELEKLSEVKKVEDDRLPSIPAVDDGNKVPSSMVRVGSWELGRELGSGAYAKVFGAKNVPSGCAEAVKVLVKKALTDEDWLNVKNEHQSLCQVGQHPNIAGLTGALQSQERIYFFMTYAKGKELFDLIKLRQQNQTFLPHEAVNKILFSISKALAHCHQQDVCHRDVKPENIMVQQDYSAILVDFGCSCPRLALQSQCVGSMPFIAPEFLLECAHDGAPADVWSLGIVLLEMLHGLRALSRALRWDSKQISSQECGEQLLTWFADPVDGLARVRSCLGVATQFEHDDMLTRMVNSNSTKRPLMESIAC